MTFTLRDFCEAGDEYVDLTTGEHVSVADGTEEGR